MFFDPLYILITIIGMVLVLVPQLYVKNTYKKYLDVPASCGLTGAEVVRQILKHNGLYNSVDSVGIECIQGSLTDHYDPRDKVIRLSEENYHGRSISAISVSAHEAGHAIQAHKGYYPIKFRETFLPVASIGDKLGVTLLMFGIIAMFWMGMVGIGQILALFGILLYGAVVLFQIITLPVEFNASKRAMNHLKTLGLVNAQEISMSKQVLVAAALTYVATALYAILNLLYYVYIFFGRRD